MRRCFISCRDEPINHLVTDAMVITLDVLCVFVNRFHPCHLHMEYLSMLQLGAHLMYASDKL